MWLFFYPDGDDVIPSDVDSGEEGDWPTTTYSSATCGSMDLEWWDSVTCDTAIEAAGNATLLAEMEQEIAASGNAVPSVTVAGHGAVSITEIDVKWLKMFHPKSKFNQQIALDIYTEILARQQSA